MHWKIFWVFAIIYTIIIITTSLFDGMNTLQTAIFGGMSGWVMMDIAQTIKKAIEKH